MERPSNRSFKRRGNRITLAQETALTKNWATYGIPEETAINPREHFPNAKRLVMEIGTGMGEATALIARDFPDDGFFAVELHKPGLGALLARMGEYGISNIRLVEEDARVLLQYFFPKGELDAVHLYFLTRGPRINIGNGGSFKKILLSWLRAHLRVAATSISLPIGFLTQNGLPKNLRHHLHLLAE